MIKKLTRHGNGWALVLDQPMLERLNIDPQTPLEVATDGQTLIIAPARDAERRARFEAALEKANREYGRALKKLAE
jgi:antitoxin MazE